jgi:TonB family protein
MRWRICLMVLAMLVAAGVRAQPLVLDTRDTLRRAEAFHILVEDEATAQALQQQLAAAPAADRLALFNRLARRNSRDWGSARAGGSLGLVWLGQTARAFEAAVFAAKPGDVGPPVETQYGWHLVYVAAFRDEPVAAFCTRTLRDAAAAAAPDQRALLEMSQRPVDRSQLVLEVATAIGKDWGTPLQDRAGNLVYFSAPIPGPDKLVLVQRHTDYLLPWLRPGPEAKGCVRSRREAWVVDCTRRRAGLRGVADHEGRAGSGAVLDRVRTTRTDHPTDVAFQPLAQGSIGAQLLAHACGAEVAGQLQPPYAQRLAGHIRALVDLREAVAGNPEAEVEVRTLRDGSVSQVRILRSSGDAAWDKAVVAAAMRAGKLPPDADGRVPPRATAVLRAGE